MKKRKTHFLVRYKSSLLLLGSHDSINEARKHIKKLKQQTPGIEVEILQISEEIVQ